MLSINNIPEDWVETTIGNLVELAQGVALNAKTNHVLSDKENGLPLLKINNLLNDTIDQYANPELVPEKSIIHKNDVIFTRTGQVGKVLINKYGILHNNSFKVIPNEKLYWNYLYWYLKSNRVYNYVQKVAAGSVQMDLNHSAFKTIEIKYPTNIDEQKAIAKVLTAFDDKIELLQAQNKTLESMAQTIFAAWFGKYQMGDELPEGWRVGKVGDLVNLKSGFSFKSKNFIENGHYKLVTIRNVKNGFFDKSTKDRLNELPKKLPDHCILKTGDILISLTGNVGRTCHVIGDNYLLNQRVCLADPFLKEYFGLTYCLFRSKPIFKSMECISVGTAQLNLSPVQTQEISLVIPSSLILRQISNSINPLIKKLIVNNIQIQSLTKTRDTLLPKLMSGQVRVKDRIDMNIEKGIKNKRSPEAAKVYSG